MSLWLGNTYVAELFFGGVAGVAVIEPVDVRCGLFFSVFGGEEDVSCVVLVEYTPTYRWSYPYLGSKGNKRSGRPASISLCRMQSSIHDGRMISTVPCFCNEAAFTVPGHGG